jgi:uncharacterized membrane protein YkvA (DUF1232 family)
MQQKPSLSPQAKAGVLLEMVRNVRLVWRLLKDKRVAIWAKAIIPATIVYLISPIDLVPDALLGLGQLDDLAVILLGVKFFIDLCPPAIVKEHLADIISVNMPRQSGPQDTSGRVDYLEGQYRVLDSPQPPQQGKDKTS